MGSHHTHELTFGDVLRRLRRAANLTQEELAERARLSVRGLSDLERGVNRFPRRETVLALADALQLGADDRAALLAAARRREPNTSPMPSAPPATDGRAAGMPAPATPAEGRAAPETPVAPVAIAVLGPPDSSAPAAPAEVEAPAASAISTPATPGDEAAEAKPAGPSCELPARPVDQRRLVTVLVAGMTSDAPAGDTIDPEDLRSLTARYLAHARTIIPGYRGTLEQTVGDTILAIFGLPQSYGDDAERALAAALALRAAVAADPLLAGRMQVGIGVSTGEVVVAGGDEGGDGARGGRLVIGEAVNWASRLQQRAEPGEILGGERTRTATEAAFRFEAPRQIEAKGKAKPLRAFPVTGPRPVRRVSRPPLVGRAGERAQLALLYQRVVEERRAQLVSVVAPAGTGKTRLLEEFLAQLDPADRERVAITRCTPYGQSLTYRPLRGLLADLLGAEVRHAGVVDAMMRAGHAAAEAARVADGVLATLGIGRDSGDDGDAGGGDRAASLDGPNGLDVADVIGAEGVIGAIGHGGRAEIGDREGVFRAWRLLLEGLTGQTPRVAVFEDLHWASDELLELVEYLMPPRMQAPIFLLVLSRPELLDRRPNWGGGRRNFTHLALEPLGQSHTRMLVAAIGKDVLVGPNRERLIAAVVERSGGNPFFAMELVSGLTDQGGAGTAGVAPTDGGRGYAANLPDTVHDAVLARLDALAPLERAVLQVAAVAGRLFRLPALCAALDDVVPSAVDAALDDLMARDIVVRAEGDAYTYRHMLFREVAYGMLSRAARIRLHAAMADWLRASGSDRPDEFAELIAYHFQRAAAIARDSAVPLELPFDAAHAVAWLVRAGRLASHGGALSQAIAYLRSAIALAPREDHPELYELLGDYATLGDAALDGYRQALERWRTARAEPPATEMERAASAQVGARLLRKVAALYLCTPGTLIEHPSGGAVRALLDEGLGLAGEAGDEDEHWRLRVVALWWPEYRGDFTLEEAEEGCRTALAAAAHFEARQHWADFSRALDGYAMHCMRKGTYADALDATQRRLDAPALPPAERSDALTMISFLNFEAGNFAACMENMRTALRGIRPGEEMVHLHAGAYYPVMAAYESGCWSALGELMAPLEALWEQAQQQASAGQRVAIGYTFALLVALAREDRVAIEAATAVIEQTMPRRLVNMRALVRALCADDPRLLELDRACGVTGLRLVVDLCNEHGVPAPAWVIDDIHAREGNVSVPHGSKVAIAEALASGDDTRLAATIEDAEVRGLVVHAARMRIVLARRSGDRAQLERAAPVLWRLGDRRGLRRLEAVAAELGDPDD